MKEIQTAKQQLITYVKKNLSKDYTTDSIKFSLLSQGYNRTSVERAIKSASEQIKQEKPKITRTIYSKANLDLMPDIKPKKQGFFQKLFGFFKR